MKKKNYFICAFEIFLIAHGFIIKKKKKIIIKVSLWTKKKKKITNPSSKGLKIKI